MKCKLFRHFSLLLILTFTLIFSPQLSQADPHILQSKNVVIIGGTFLDIGIPCGTTYGAANNMNYTGGGCLPVTGPAGELGDFNFSAMDPSAVSAASLAPFDTAVLNLASIAMHCDTGVLSVLQKVDLIAWVNQGNKLTIYDSECAPNPVDYTWLPVPFITSNPGALGAQGTLNIVEENTFSSTDIADPHYIDAPYLGTSTDAVGDMNVMTTFDPNWFVDMSGTNILGVTGPVHTYANLPIGTDDGLIIYNGLDVDYLYFDEANLRKIWVQELQQEFNPAALPSSVSVVGITLDPLGAVNEIGDNHTVYAVLKDLEGIPQENILVSFDVTSGPNVGSAGTCSPNADCTSDANGQVDFTYKGAGGVGIDEIRACFIDDNSQEVCSQTVTKEWIRPPCEQIWPPEVRTQGYWNYQCKALGLIGVVKGNLKLHEEWMKDMDDLTEVCNNLDADLKDMCSKAGKQLQALRLNIMSGKIAECNCLSDGSSVGDAITAIEEMIANGNCTAANDKADAINNGYSIVNCD